MAQKDFLSDIDCPQFVDFAAGLSEDLPNDVFFESSKDCCTPVSANPRIAKRAVSTLFNKPTNRRLIGENQRTERVRCIQEHPKTPESSSTAAVRERLQRSPCVNLERRSPYEEITERHSRRRSQSESNIADTVKPKVGFCLPILRKRSLSADDLRVRRKATIATTPLCLKRPKRGKQIKTTEELELEKIAQMQKELRDRLRFNEMTMKRLELKKRVNAPRIELPMKTPCMFKEPEPPRAVEKFIPRKKPSCFAFNNLRRTDEEARFQFRNSKTTAQSLAPPITGNNIGTQRAIRNLRGNSSTISCGSKSDAEKSMEVVRERTELKSKHSDFLAPPMVQINVGARKKTNNQWGNQCAISCGSKSDAEKSMEVVLERTEPRCKQIDFLASANFQKNGAPKETRNLCSNQSKSDVEKSIEVVPKRTELKSKHFDFLAPAMVQKNVGARKKTNNLWGNQSTISCGSKSDAEKSIEVVPKRILLQNLSNSIHSCDSKSEAEESMEGVPKRPLGVKNTGFHSGIKFPWKIPEERVKPFAFEKPEETNSKAVNEPCLPNCPNVPLVRRMKENVPLKRKTNDGGHEKRP